MASVSTAELLYIVDCNDTEDDFTYTGLGPISVTNVGSFNAAISFEASITNTTPETPVEAAGEIIILPGETVPLPNKRNKFFHVAAASPNDTTLRITAEK